MTTFKDIFKMAKEGGFSSIKVEKGHDLRLDKQGNLSVLMWVPNDDCYLEAGDNDTIAWGYDIIETSTGTSLLKGWQDVYGDTIEQVIEMLKDDYSQFIEKVTQHELRIASAPKFRIWIFQYGQRNILEYKLDSGWHPVD